MLPQQDFLRENESGLRECLDAISGEVDDWAENLGDGAVDNINVKIDAKFLRRRVEDG